MSDETEKKDPATQAAEAAKAPPKVAKPGQDDSESIVTGAGGALMSGRIADIADGDT